MEIINSISDTIKERTKNPFFGTLILVWLFRNWEVVFAIFNFKEGFGHQEKIDFIKEQYENKLLWGIFVNNLLIALGLMILGYVLIVLTRFIVSFVEHKCMPHIHEFADNKLIVSKERFNDVKKARDQYAQSNEDLQELLIQSQQKLNHQKLENERLSKETDSLLSENEKLHDVGAKADIKLLEKDKEINNLINRVNGLTHDLQSSDEAVNNLQRNKFEFANSVIGYLKHLNVSESSRFFGFTENILNQPYRDLRADNQVDNFIKFYERIFLRRKQIEINDDFTYFKRLNLVEGQGRLITSTPAGDMIYLLERTDLGKQRGMGL